MILQILKDYGELISITLIPFIIWWLGSYFQDRKSKNEAKLNLFLSLMANRKSTPVSKEWVDALNKIDVVFQEDKNVRIAWRAYYKALNQYQPNYSSQNAYHLDLLAEMANSLGYRNLKQTEIDRYYTPQAFGNLLDNQDLLTKETLRVLSNSKAYGVAFSPEELEERLQDLHGNRSR